ncbi:4'-phosphopantetheinyl transferase superfamily protein [Robbsia andropogonis]|nr:4'-phosphopantetheinyl transferase superfamily protein [Robbsia andropogonis]
MSASVLASIGNVELLDAGGVERFNALKREADRWDFLAARVLVKHVMSRMTGAAPSTIVIEQFCADCNRSGHGKPFSRSHPGLSVSWSHQGGLVMAAVSCFEVGVDVEILGTMPSDADFANNVLSESELKIFDGLGSVRSDGVSLRQLYTARQWVRKEAIIKLGALSLERMPALSLEYLGCPDFSSHTFQSVNTVGVYGIMDFSIAHWACVGALAWGKESLKPLPIISRI